MNDILWIVIVFIMAILGYVLYVWEWLTKKEREFGVYVSLFLPILGILIENV
jgi:uncharacterized membrane protein